MKSAIYFLCLLCTTVLLGIVGCDSSDLTDDITSLLNIEFNRTFEITNPETEETYSATVRVSGKEVEYSDSEGYSGNGTLDATHFTAAVSGPEGVTGTVFMDFDQEFHSYTGTLDLSDGTHFDFNGETS
ncbi:MAG: hypothetical protein P9M03_04845 [Candidatus Theseobacter exili]|nr:hypothetical protein [Candidatus Theseobacter exili]